MSDVQTVQFFDGLLFWGLAAVVVLVVAVAALGAFFTVETQTVHIVERFERFLRVAHPGLNVKLPFVDKTWDLSLQMQVFKLEVETKTKDNVFVKFAITVQYRVPPGSEKDAFYLLDDPNVQIKALVSHVVVSEVPKMDLDDVFEHKSLVATALVEELRKMHQYGYEVTDAFITDIAPDGRVQEAMNAINAAQRNQEAAKAAGEAEKIRITKAAEGEAESKRLQGEGTAQQRVAIARGLKESMELLKDTGVGAEEAMVTLLMNQYLDALRTIGAADNVTTLMIPHQPGALTDLLGQMRAAVERAPAVV